MMTMAIWTKNRYFFYSVQNQLTFARLATTRIEILDKTTENFIMAQPLGPIFTMTCKGVIAYVVPSFLTPQLAMVSPHIFFSKLMTYVSMDKSQQIIERLG
jgi:hypothetical protein